MKLFPLLSNATASGTPGQVVSAADEKGLPANSRTFQAWRNPSTGAAV